MAQMLFTFSGADESVPYWSPDSHFLLFAGLHSLCLVQIASGQEHMLLTSSSASAKVTSVIEPNVTPLLQPASNSLWAADSRHFLFLARNSVLWQGKQLRSGSGLYTASISNDGQAKGAPVFVDGGNDTQAGWTYEDANTSFLY